MSTEEPGKTPADWDEDTIGQNETNPLKITIMDDSLMTVAKFDDPMRADIVKGMLENCGIEAAVFGEFSAYPSINAVEGNIELKVNAKDYDKALSIIEASQSAE